VRRRANRHANTSHPETEDLRTDDPRQAGVREAEAHSEDVDESDGGIASSGQFVAFARTGDFDVCSDEPHRDQHDRSTSHEHLSSAEAINDVVHGDDDAHKSDNAVDASGIQAGRGSSKTDRFEDSRRVVTVTAESVIVHLLTMLDHELT
jgi:hypothetical protein